MTFRDFPGTAHRGAAAFAVAAAAIAACSSSPPPPPQAFVNATLGPYIDPTSKQNLCSNGSPRPVLQIGVATGGTGPIRQADGSNQFDGNVNVQCSVTSGFEVSLTAALGGLMGGQLGPITGHVTSASGGTGISGSINVNLQSYTASNCTIAFTYNGTTVPVKDPVAPGRIWAHLHCPSVVNAGHAVLLPDGTTSSETCALDADFVFENCSQ